MNVPVWILIVFGIVLAYFIISHVSMSKEITLAKSKCRELESSLSAEKQTCKKQSVELAHYSAQTAALTELLSKRQTSEDKQQLEKKAAEISACLESSIEQKRRAYLSAEWKYSSAKSILNSEQKFTAEDSELYKKLSSEAKGLTCLAQNMVDELSLYKDFFEKAQSNLVLFPYMAGIVSELETRDIETLARKLDWGYNIERAKKVASIRAIRHEAQEKIEQAKVAEYQLAYLLQMFPSLKDLLEYEYSELPHVTADDLSEYDTTRDYLSKEEWESLSTTERNQLALDRYVASRKKTNWQVGRDYEEYVGYRYRTLGFSVDNFGVYMGIDDLGRDVIAKKDGKTYVIQCKYWSQKKEIHENHINQLFGTVTSYKIENNASDESVIGVLITNTQLSERAKKFADRLHIKYKEHFEIGDFPRIKCNIGHSELGSRIYHLPFDQQYDAAKICNPGEFYALTVEEAEKAGFRRAFKWHGA